MTIMPDATADSAKTQKANAASVMFVFQATPRPYFKARGRRQSHGLYKSAAGNKGLPPKAPDELRRVLDRAVRVCKGSGNEAERSLSAGFPQEGASVGRNLVLGLPGTKLSR